MSDEMRAGDMPRLHTRCHTLSRAQLPDTLAAPRLRDCRQPSSPLIPSVRMSGIGDDRTSTDRDLPRQIPLSPFKKHFQTFDVPLIPTEGMSGAGRLTQAKPGLGGDSQNGGPPATRRLIYGRVCA